MATINRKRQKSVKRKLCMIQISFVQSNHRQPRISMLAVRIDSNLRQCMRIYEISSKCDIFEKYKYSKTDLPCAWCCVCFCLCAFRAIFKRFRRLLIFHVQMYVNICGS